MAIYILLLKSTSLPHAHTQRISETVLTSGFVWFLGSGLPADFGNVAAEGKEAMILAAVGSHLDKFAPILHVSQTVLRC